MKSINHYISNNYDINETFKSEYELSTPRHGKAYIDLVKWYDKQIERRMGLNKDEAIEVLKYAIDAWEHDNF